MMHKVKITLGAKEYKITRTVLIPFGLTFKNLHDIIQTSMSWNDYHLHEFIVPDMKLRIVMDEDFDSYISHDEAEPIFESNAFVDDFVNMKLVYVYDFGDEWVHRIAFLKDTDKYDLDYPKVIKYSGNCPPEDCGGLCGYLNSLEILKDKNHPDYEELSEWYGEPKDYDVDDVNARLKYIFDPKINKNENKDVKC